MRIVLMQVQSSCNSMLMLYYEIMATPRKDPKNYLPIGRPIKYNPSEMCPRIIELMKEGAALCEVAADIGINKNTISAWCQKYPEFSRTIEEGKALSEAWWYRTGRENMHSDSFIAVLWFYNMKNRFGWRDKTDVTSDNKAIDQSTKIANIYAIAESDMAKLLTEKLKDDTK